MTFGLTCQHLRRPFATAVGLLLAASAWAEPDGELVKVKVNEVRPTQFNVGMLEVQSRQEEVVKLIKNTEKLEKLLQSEAGLAIRGPGGKLYLVDGHHFARALSDSEVPEMYVKVIGDYPNLSEKAFWKKLVHEKLAHLYDQGIKRPPSALPKEISKATDDPFRSLAWIIIKIKGCKDLGSPFYEFVWAKFFRKKGVKIDFSSKAGIDKATQDALSLAGSKEACEVPGNIQRKQKKLDLDSDYKCARKYRKLRKKLTHYKRY